MHDEIKIQYDYTLIVTVYVTVLSSVISGHQGRTQTVCTIDSSIIGEVPAYPDLRSGLALPPSWEHPRGGKKDLTFG